jgi:hypothetical protein
MSNIPAKYVFDGVLAACVLAFLILVTTSYFVISILIFWLLVAALVFLRTHDPARSKRVAFALIACILSLALWGILTRGFLTEDDSIDRLLGHDSVLPH